MTTVRIGDISPNPFRDIEHYPIDAGKIAALVASIESTGFWDNVVGRVFDGTHEIAYGHHRLAALREALGEDATIDLILRDLDDETMLRIMADENMQEWTSSAAIEQETIAAVVRAYAEGRITLAKPNGKASRDRVRHAPGYGPRSNGNHPYTPQTVATFLRWPIAKVERALTALAAVEADEVPRETFRDLGSTLSERVVQAAHTAERRATKQGVAPDKAKEIGRTVATRLADDFRSGAGRAIGTAITERRDRIIDEVLPGSNGKMKAVPLNVAVGVERMVDDFFRRSVDVNGSPLALVDLIGLIAENRDAVELRGTTGPIADKIADALLRMAVQAERLASDLVSERMLTAGAR